MMDMETEKSYLEIKVTFHHILILLAGVILIGSFLFYLGYQAGKSSSKKSDRETLLAKGDGQTKEIEILSKKNDPDKIDEEPPSISEEIKLHQPPVKKTKSQPKKKAKKKSQTEEVDPTKAVKRTPYFTIQVAAFNSHALARDYSKKFSKAGYPTSISQATVKGKIWYRVRVGNFNNRGDAQREKKKLERLENKKFRIVKTE